MEKGQFHHVSKHGSNLSKKTLIAKEKNNYYLLKNMVLKRLATAQTTPSTAGDRSLRVSCSHGVSGSVLSVRETRARHVFERRGRGY